MKPFEFIIPGPPLSHQTKNRVRLQAWKRGVRNIARKKWIQRKQHGPVAHEVSVEVIYFYDTTSPDVDNMVKPIQDALLGLIYKDDRQVMNTTGRKRNINKALRIRGISAVMARGFVSGDDFVYVKITQERDLTRLD